MTPQINLVHDHIGPSLQKYADVMGRTLSDTVKRAAKGITRRVIAITPPAHQGVEGAAAYRYGRQKIKSDMSRVLAPVKLKGRRLITKVFGRPLARPITIKTAEKYPDVVSVYKQHRRFRRIGVGVTSTNLKEAKFYVDARKFNRLLKLKEANVGRLASGWSEGAAALDVPVQQWISRHGRGRGTAKLDLMGSRMRITVRNLADNLAPSGLPSNALTELSRRIKYAVQYQEAAMRREVEYYMMKKARDLSIRTRNFDALVPEGMMGRSDA
jgi:hypothetical protein